MLVSLPLKLQRKGNTTLLGGLSVSDYEFAMVGKVLLYLVTLMDIDDRFTLEGISNITTSSS